jgi:hypothetical protein
METGAILRLTVKARMDGRTVIDTVGPEALVKAIAERFREKRLYSVHISYP